MSFLEGDPDRPLITGAVYNAEQTVPYTLPGDQTNDPPVVIMQLSQTTSGMGVYPNDSGNKCISDLVWEAVKWKLGVPEQLNSNICQ